jgi:hypothetical protein
MTRSSASSDNYGCVFDSVGESSTELVLQPRYNRHLVMSQAWQGLILFEILFLPMFTVLPTVLLMTAILLPLSMYAPELQNHQIIRGFIFLLWIGCLAAIIFLTWKAVCDSGYKTFIFDRIQQQLVINIANVAGGQTFSIIPFDLIEDAHCQECNNDGMSVDVFLILKEHNLPGSVPKGKIVLSSFSSEEYKTVANLTLREEHQELLLLVRTALGFSTDEILDKLRSNPSIPTEVELQQEKAQAISAAKESIATLTKTIFSTKQEKQSQLEVLREKTCHFPEDPQIWEDFALLLAMQQNPAKTEIIYAYRQAESLYLDREDTESAMAIAKIIKDIN